MKPIRLVTAAVVAAVTLGATSGCSRTSAGATDQAPACLGFVIGARANSAPVSGRMITDLIPDPLPVGSHIAMTGVSGSPNGDPIGPFTVKSINNSYRQADAQLNARNGAIAAVDKAAAGSPQADTLGALESTADELRLTGLAGCTIYVLDSGLSTVGLVQFQQGEQGLLAADAATIVQKIPAASTLAGMTIRLETLGKTAGDQPELDSTAKVKLEAIWSGIIQRRGGSLAAPVALNAGGTATGSTYPVVDVVPVPRERIDWTEVTPACTKGTTTWDLPSDGLFEDSQAVLRPTAGTILDQAAQVLLDHPSATVTSLVGHTASISGTTSGLDLSRQRAQVVMDYLVSKGIAASRITGVAGVGDSQPVTTCEDWNPATGRQIEDCAVLERTVSLTVSGIELCQS